MTKTKKAKTPKKIVWVRANQTRSKISVGIGRKRVFLNVELFGPARDRVREQIKRWDAANYGW
jgi:hypothetical protein